MSQRLTPGLLIPALLAIFALTALVLIAGCGKKGAEEAGGTGSGRLTLGGDAAAELAAEEAAAGGAPTAAPQEVAESTEPAGAPTGGPAGRGGRGGGRGGRGGGGGRGPGGATAPAAGAEQAAAPAEDATEAAEGEDAAEGEEPAQKTGISEVDVAKRVNEFSSLYGPLSRVKEKYWNDTTTDWLIFTYTNDGDELTSAQKRLKGRRIKLPVSMAVDAFDLSMLDGYFPIYVATALRPSGEVVSRQDISVKRVPMEEYKEKIGEERAVIVAEQAAADAAAAEAADAAGPAAGGTGGGGPGGGGPRGGRGGGPRGGGW